MLQLKKLEAKTLTPISLSEVLTGEEDQDVYTIENVFQRELVWNTNLMEQLWKDILNLIKHNIDSSKPSLSGGKNYTKSYMDIGSLEVSEVEKCNEKYKQEGVIYKSVVDGGQRIRITAIIAMAFLYIRAKQEKSEFIDTSLLKNEAGSYKVTEMAQTKLDNFYKMMEITPISKLEKSINKMGDKEQIARKMQGENEEKDYFQIFCYYVRCIEEDIYGSLNVSECLTIFLSNIAMSCEKIDIAQKFDRFVDRNKKNTPMSDESLYPKYIINQYGDDEKEKVLKAFQDFKKVAEIAETSTEEQPQTFRRTKSGIGAILYIMIESLKIKLGEESLDNSDINYKTVFSSTFDLKNFDYGIDKCFENHYVFKTSEDAIEYFNLCRKIAEFLINDSFTKHNSIYKDCYYLRDFAAPNVIWWYFIKPVFLTHTVFSGSDETQKHNFKFMKEILYRLYCVYVVVRSSNTNSQNLINLLETVSYMIIKEGRRETTDFEDNIKKLFLDYINKFGGYDAIKAILYNLSYQIKNHKRPIENVFKAMEYYLCSKYQLSTDNFYKLWYKKGKTQTYNLDHWYPQALFEGKNDGEEKMHYNKLGNLVLLGESLNKSKGANPQKNSETYSQCHLYQTLFIDKENRGDLCNAQLVKIKSNPYVLSFDKEHVNNPTLEDIKGRTDNYVDFFINFIKEVVGE